MKLRQRQAERQFKGAADGGLDIGYPYFHTIRSSDSNISSWMTVNSWRRK
ncbi:hypothetical protein ACT17R_15350 [Sphingopyxis sp. Q841]